MCLDPSCDIHSLVDEAIRTRRPHEAVVVTLPTAPLSVNVIPAVGERAQAQLLRERVSLDPSGQRLVVPMMANPRTRMYKTMSSWAARNGVPTHLGVLLCEVELAFAITDYKVQGKTLDYFVVVLKRPVDGRVRPRLALCDLEVLLSRVRLGRRMFVLGFQDTDADRQWLLQLRHPPALHLWEIGYTDGRWDAARVRAAADAYIAAMPLARLWGATHSRGPAVGHVLSAADQTSTVDRETVGPTGVPLVTTGEGSSAAGQGEPTVPALPNNLRQGVAGRSSTKRPFGGLPETRSGDAAAARAPSALRTAARRPRAQQQAPLTVARYRANSCPYDSALIVWETVQRWLTHGGLAPLPYPPPAVRTFQVGPSYVEERAMDLATPLQQWFHEREALARCTTQQMRKAAQLRLEAIRATLRYADAPLLVPFEVDTVDALNDALQRAVKEPGSADAVLRRLFHPATASSRFCRVDRNARPCTHGVRNNLRHDCMCSLTEDETRRARNCPWAAYASRLEGAVQAGTYTLPHCDQRGCDDNALDRLSVTNCGPEAPADLVALHLPSERCPDPPVNLHSSAEHHLPTHDASYQLVAALMFTAAFEHGHYVAVVQTPEEPRDWICYDANANAGVGWRVPPPTGFDRLEPGSAPTASEAPGYWPAVLLYVRVPPPTPSTGRGAEGAVIGRRSVRARSGPSPGLVRWS